MYDEEATKMKACNEVTGEYDVGRIREMKLLGKVVGSEHPYDTSLHPALRGKPIFEVDGKRYSPAVYEAAPISENQEAEDDYIESCHRQGIQYSDSERDRFRQETGDY